MKEACRWREGRDFLHFPGVVEFLLYVSFSSVLRLVAEFGHGIQREKVTAYKLLCIKS